MMSLLVTLLAISFASTFLICRVWIPIAHRIQLTGKDMNKANQPPVAEMGGIAVIGGAGLGILTYVGLLTFVMHDQSHIASLLAVLVTLLLMGMIGMVDDILGWKIGIRMWHKLLLTIPCALPLMVVNAGKTMMSFPFIGMFDVGWAYPLFFIPIAIVGASNGFNLLAGYNGLEAGMGAIILSALGFVTWQIGEVWVAVFAFIIVAALLAFLIFNWMPAKLFPGDTLTYTVGAAIACVAILGNVEKMAAFLFIPYFFDFFLPLRKKLKVEAFAKVGEDGSLSLPYKGIYDMTHGAIACLSIFKKKVREQDVVLSILALEVVLVIVSLLIWGNF